MKLGARCWVIESQQRFGTVNIRTANNKSEVEKNHIDYLQCLDIV